MSFASADNLKAHNFTDFQYTHDATYTKILVRDALDAATRVTADNSCTVGSSPTNTHHKFVLPSLQKYLNTVNGEVNGAIKFKFYAKNTGLSSDEHTTTVNATIYLKSVTNGGVETTLGSASIKQIAWTRSLASGGGEATENISVPYWFAVAAGLVIAGNKIVLDISVDASYDGAAGGNWIATLDLKTALNSDDTYVVLPMV